MGGGPLKNSGAARMYQEILIERMGWIRKSSSPGI
jgi:hypothetical protein